MQSTTGGATLFRIRRQSSATNGTISDTDPRVAAELETLETLLGKRAFELPSPEVSAAAANPPQPLDPGVVLALALTPRRVPGQPEWERNSLAAVLDKAAVDDRWITLAEVVDRTPNLATIKYDVEDALATGAADLDDASKRVLGDAYPAIRGFLIAYAFAVLGLRDTSAVKNFIVKDRNGAHRIADYAVIGAARDLVQDTGYKVKDYDKDDSDFVKDLRQAGIGLSLSAFQPGVLAVIDNTVSRVDHSDLLDKAEAIVGPLTIQTKRLLAQYIDASPTKITPANIQFFAPVWLTQISGLPATDVVQQPPAPSDQDFDIEVFQDDPSAFQISRSAVKCAAQLYYTMVLGDELDVFSVVNYFTHKYLVRGSMEIRDARLRDDLQLYVFSNRFTDLKNGRQQDRSRPAERHMFQRQVFDLGRVGRHHMPEDVIVNDDFQRLWKVLMLESANYLERAQTSFYPDNFVSRQKVMQAVEDLQYNLSTHCIGMATVATPLIHAELNFVIRRLLMHPEVLTQVVPIGGTWWRVVERIYQEMKHTRPKATVFYSKATVGHDIINAVADYDPATFQNDTEFSHFISLVDSFITTQSILQDALTDDLKRQQEDVPPPAAVQPVPVAPAPAPVAPDGGASNGAAHKGDWDF